VSSLDPDKINCGELSKDVYQLAIILYPAELFNEKFLIKIRDCVVKLPDGHPVKRWLKSVAKTKPPTEGEGLSQAFLSEVVNSQFNLITDARIKNRIIEIITDIDDRSMPEKILKSFLYLMIGNITRSDNILGSIIKKTPVENWKGFESKQSFYHRFAKANMDQLFNKLSKHPADRRIFQLFNMYLQSFFNEKTLIKITSEQDFSTLDGKLDLKFVEFNAPELVHFLRFNKLSENRRIARLRNKRYTLKEQAYWYWPFLDIDPLISDELQSNLIQIEQSDELWFIYLMENEKLLDLYIKNSKKGFLTGRRKFLRETLKQKDVFMLALFKLIEFGDIDQSLVEDIVLFFSHE